MRLPRAKALAMTRISGLRVMAAGVIMRAKPVIISAAVEIATASAMPRNDRKVGFARDGGKWYETRSPRVTFNLKNIVFLPQTVSCVGI